jgi:hypothetical protein
MIHARMQTQQLEKEGGGKDLAIDREANAGEEDIMSSFPRNYQWKWPLTRAERLKELDELSARYDKTRQRANINAVKLWHSQFPKDQIIPDEVVTFQGGKRVDEAEIDLEGDVIWDEVSKGYYSL